MTALAFQALTLELDGITAGDYLAWVRDPEPPALGEGLSEVRVQGDPLGHTIEATLVWRRAVPSPSIAAHAAGLPLTPEVIGVESRELTRATAAGRRENNGQVRRAGLCPAATDLRRHASYRGGPNR